MSIKHDQCYQIAKSHLGKVWESLTAGFQTHAIDPLRMIYDTSTRASVANDLMFAQLVSNFDGVRGVQVLTDNKNHLRFLCIEDAVLLWLKKVSIGRSTSNYPTHLAIERLDGQMFLEGLPQASIITLGYLANAEESAIDRISFCPPFQGKPEWYFDLVPVSNVTQMGQRERRSKGAKFIVVHGTTQEGLGS